MGARPNRFEPLDDDLERHVLVLVGGQAALSHLGEHLGGGRVPAEVDPQDQGVDEAPHQVVQRGIAAAGDRKSYRDIGTRAELGQQHHQGGLDHHEAGDVVLAGRGAHPLVQLGRPSHRRRRAAVVRHRRIGPVGGQLQALGHAGQGVLPEPQLGGERAVAVVEATELGALPQRVIGVLHR
ncbi:hypothetical protein LAUMK7_05719 [Mycobacterium kansasii]|nr:hypothetical protein LAUMK22_05719 [Mycobacterium kansasii]VAZ69780.1 hypothetical protein LAUMK40_05943 [Mycobacterium kansasii]VAZ81152.1 hypothetical protein LAUMK7_05719 [Mycobacterium kansasii]